MEKDNDIIVLHYSKDNPEAYVWFHRDEWTKYKEFCDEQDRRFISGGRYLFSFEKEDLIDRVSWYYSKEYNYRKMHRKNG